MFAYDANIGRDHVTSCSKLLLHEQHRVEYRRFARHRRAELAYLKTRFPSSSLLPFLFGGLLIKAEYQEKGYPYY